MCKIYKLQSATNDKEVCRFSNLDLSNFYCKALILSSIVNYKVLVAFRFSYTIYDFYEIGLGEKSAVKLSIVLDRSRKYLNMFCVGGNYVYKGCYTSFCNDSTVIKELKCTRICA